MARKPAKAPTVIRTRWIETSYYDEKHRLICVNAAVYAESAVTHAVQHMQANDYHASSADVCDAYSGKLYAIIKRHVNGNIAILYQDTSIPKSRKSKIRRTKNV